MRAGRDRPRRPGLAARPGFAVAQSGFALAQSGFAVAVMAFLVLPILAVLPISLSAGSFLSYPLPGLSLQWYEKVFRPEPWMSALKNSLAIGGLTTLLATVLGTLAAIGLAKRIRFGKSLLLSLVLSPMIVPPIVYAVAIYFFFARFGLNATYLGMVIAHTVLALPFVVVPVLATLSTFDQTLVRAGASLGASPLRVFRHVTLPNILPGVLTGAVFAFATSFDEVIVAIFVAGAEQQTLPRQMIEGIRDSIDPSILAISTVLIVFALLMMAASLRLSRGRAPSRKSEI